MEQRPGAKAVPLTKEYDPPAEVPTVELVRWRDRGLETLQQGVHYTGEWIVDGRLERAGERLPMPWPEVVSLEGDENVFVSFGDVPHPEFVEVRVFGAETDSNGMPADEEPIRTLECALSDPDTCIQRRGDRVGVEVAIPSGGVRHVTAWASWNLPLQMQSSLGVDAGDVYASWLFKVRRSAS